MATEEERRSGEARPARPAVDAEGARHDARAGRAKAQAEPDEGADEGTLVVRARLGDATAFAALVRRHTGPLLGYARSLVGTQAEAEDRVQEAFLKAWRGLERHDPSRSFGGWLHRIVHNACIDGLRARRAWEPLDEVEPPAPTRDAPLELDDVSAIDAAVAELHPRQRAALHARFALGLDAAEIAARLDTTPGNVRVVLHRAVAALRKTLAGRFAP